jgi:hypothetical protein
MSKTAVVLCVSVLATGCIARYSDRPRVVSAETTTQIRETATADATIRRNWQSSHQLCSQIRGHMLDEADGIAARNLAIGSVFAAVAAGIALSTTLYAGFEGDAADSRVVGVLSALSATSVAPTFFYFGSPEREREVRARMRNVDTLWQQADTQRQTLDAQGIATASADSAADRARSESARAATASQEATQLLRRAESALREASVAVGAARGGAARDRAARAESEARRAHDDARTTFDRAQSVVRQAQSALEAAERAQTEQSTSQRERERELNQTLHALETACQ